MILNQNLSNVLNGAIENWSGNDTNSNLWEFDKSTSWKRRYRDFENYWNKIGNTKRLDE